MGAKAQGDAERTQDRVGLVYTLSCPLGCDHCCHDPRTYGTATFEAARAVEIIRQALSLGSVERLFITGGEPFLFHREILEVLSQARLPDVPVRIVTSACWAETPEVAKSLLRPLSRLGVDLLSISTDPSHELFVPLERVRCAAHTALSVGMRVEIVSTFWRPGMEMRSRLALPDSDAISYIEGLVAPTGRAQNYRTTWKEYELPYPPSESCGCERRPGGLDITVYPDGSVYPCCAGGFNLKAGLAVGNVYHEPLADIVARMRADPFIRVMRQGGPALIYELCRRHHPDLCAALPRDDDLCMACQICVALNSNPALKRSLGPVLTSAGMLLDSAGRLRRQALARRQSDAPGLAS